MRRRSGSLFAAGVSEPAERLFRHLPLTLSARSVAKPPWLDVGAFTCMRRKRGTQANPSARLMRHRYLGVQLQGNRSNECDGAPVESSRSHLELNIDPLELQGVAAQEFERDVHSQIEGLRKHIAA